jgi:hypothetical protein
MPCCFFPCCCNCGDAEREETTGHQYQVGREHDGDSMRSRRNNTQCCHTRDRMGVPGLFRRVWHRYDSVSTTNSNASSFTEGPDSQCSPLRPAQTFHSTCNIPSIDHHEFVMPGSKVQEQMAAFMLSSSKQQDGAVSECVLCMEPFDPTNPRIPTHCACSVQIHLPCLYQWRTKSSECPTCQKPLLWDEL